MLFKTVVTFLQPYCPETLKTLSRGLICVPVFVLGISGFHPDLPEEVNYQPVISAVSVSSITESSVIINWTTNVPANSQVKYGTSSVYGLSTLVDSTVVISHSMILRGLAPGTQYHYQIVSGDNNSLSLSANNTFTTANLSASMGELNGHTILAFPAGKIVPWGANPTEGYDNVMALAWNYLLNGIPNDPATGKPAYYSRSYINPDTQEMVDWPHNPAGLYAMLIESAVKYYHYSGDTNVMRMAEDIAIWHLDNGMTLPNDNWPSVPYASGDAGSLNYGGAAVGNANGMGDGVGYIQPDKIGELGKAWLSLYKYSGNNRYRDAAIQAANVLSNKIRVGTQIQSPWPFRVNAHTGVVREDYCSNISAPIGLLDGLIAAGLGDTAAYRIARTSAWNWMMTYPMQNNAWAQYFEDVTIQGSYNNNLNQYNAMMVARYLLEHPEFDPAWETHVRGLITWVENTFAQPSVGANIIKEQLVFHHAMGSHSSRYASVLALLYEKTGDLVAKEKAYRAFNWSTYMTKPNGVVIDGPNVNNQWFTDGYGDYVRHIMTGIGAVPEWSPDNETHLARSSSVVRNIIYGSNSVDYTTYDDSAREVLHINFNPVSVMADGVALPKRTDLTQPGWTLDVATKTLKVYHNNATQISISAGPSVRSVCPGATTSFIMPKPGSDYTYQWQIDSTGNGFVNLVNDPRYTGITTDTLWLNTPPTSYYGYKYRCIASRNGIPFSGPTFIIKFSLTWNGNTSTDWANPDNWNCNHVPDGFVDVVIPSGLIYHPFIYGDAIARSVTVSQGSVLLVNPGVRLVITGK